VSNLHFYGNSKLLTFGIPVFHPIFFCKAFDLAMAEKISREVEEQIIASKISLVTAPLVRELVDAKLIEKGLEEARKMHTRLGVPLYDVDQLILHPNRENANVPHGPEATNLTLAERIKKVLAPTDYRNFELGQMIKLMSQVKKDLELFKYQNVLSSHQSSCKSYPT
jgi:hypothetical protein